MILEHVCMTVQDFWLFADILNLQAIDVFGDVMVAQFENVTHSYEVAEDGYICHIDSGQ